MNEYIQPLSGEMKVDTQLQKYQYAWRALEPLLIAGVQFQKNDMLFRVRLLLPEDSAIEKLCQRARELPQLAEVSQESLEIIAASHRGIIVEAQDYNQDWNVASYLSAEMLDRDEEVRRLQLPSEMRVIEMRSSMTFPGYTGLGLNTLLKKLQACNLYAQTGLIPIAFTDDIPSFNENSPIRSESVGVNQRLGLRRVLVADLTEESFQSSLVQPCPQGRCVLRGDAQVGHPACGCSIWYWDPKNGIPLTKIPQIDTVLVGFDVFKGANSV